MPRTVAIGDHANARIALSHPDLSRHPALRGATDPLERHVLNAVGEDHARQRRIVATAIDRQTPRILPDARDLVDALLDALPTGVEFDFAGRYAHPLALHAVDLLLDLTGEDPHELRWWHGVAMAIDSHRVTEPLLRTVRERLGGRTRMLRETCTDLGLELDDEELAANVFFAFLAGFTNLANVVGNAALALAHHPDQYTWLAADPRTRVGGATDELLRYAEPSGRSSMRVAAATVELNGQRIDAGDTVRICRGLANRDPARFAEPDRLDLARAPGGQLTLGFGPHYCPGSALTRYLIDFTLLGLVRRFDALQATVDSWDLQGGAPLPMTFLRRY